MIDMAKLDFSDDNNILKIQNGDFVIENSELQQASTIVEIAQGENKQFPLIGVNIDQFIGSTIDKTILYSIIASQLEEDELYIDSVSAEFTNNDVTFEIILQ
jgi:hypothetical protein